MEWIEFVVRVPKECVEPVCNLFSIYSPYGVSVEEHVLQDKTTLKSAALGHNITVRSCLLKDDSLQEKRARIGIGLTLIGQLYDLEPPEENEIDEKTLLDQCKNSHSPIEIGRSIVIKPSWRSFDNKDRPVVIEIDPGLAFGTGYHPTTQLCLELLEDLCPVDKLLDVGTGSGILSIAAAKLGTGKVVSIDIDPTAVRVANENAFSNGVADQIKIQCISLKQLRFKEGEYLLIVANLYSNLLEDLVALFYKLLSSKGSLVISGILLEQSAQVKGTFKSHGWFIKREISLEDWVVIEMVKDGELCIDSS